MSVSVLGYLENSADLHPNALAVIDEHRALTYEELRAASQRVGSALAQADAYGRGVIVAMEKSADALATQLGILYAGAYYVPVDPAIPAGRLSRIAEAVGDAIIIVDSASEGHISEAGIDAEIVRYDEVARFEIDRAALSAARSKHIETDPAYVMFTSGSTGIPKGAVISHRAIASFIETFVEAFDIRSTDRIGNQAPFDFDVSTKDIYAALAASATLVLIPRRLFMQPAALVDYIEEHRVTVLIWAVAALCILSTYHALDERRLNNIRSVLFSGEVMPSKHLKAWRDHLPQATFANLYGPTEATCNCLYHVLDPRCDYAGGIPLGAPFSHCDVLLVDDEGREITEPGAIGEILVRGPSVALGYLGQPELTRRSFTQNPQNARYADRVYRTGDLASFDERGLLYFRGRRDNQVKHFGHRIELEEVDLAFERMPGVNRCRCAFDGRRRQIRAFYEGSASERELPALMREKLPSFMMPSSICRVKDMPLNKNGKIDRAKLLETRQESSR